MNAMPCNFSFSRCIQFLTLLLLVACTDGKNPPAGTEHGDSKTKKTALLLVNHGSRSGEWKKQLLELEQRVSFRILALKGIDTLATAFMEHAEPSIAKSLRELDRNGYTDIIVIPVFLTAGTHVFDDIPTIIGKKENPATLEQMRLEGIERYVPKARTYLAGPLGFSSLLRQNVLRRAKALSTNPDEEALVLVGYGSSEFPDIWTELFATTGLQVCRDAGFAGHTTAWCGHIAHYSPDSTTSAITRTLKRHQRAIVIPLLVSFSEKFQIDIIGGGVASVPDNRRRVRYKPDAILPDTELEAWIVSTAQKQAAAIRAGTRLP